MPKVEYTSTKGLVQSTSTDASFSIDGALSKRTSETLLNWNYTTAGQPIFTNAGLGDANGALAAGQTCGMLWPNDNGKLTHATLTMIGAFTTTGLIPTIVGPVPATDAVDGVVGLNLQLDSETTDQFLGLADGLALENTPGTVWEYNTPAYLMMFTMLEKATGENLEEYAGRKLFGPLGMNSAAWVKIVVSEEVTNYRRIESNTRDMARFGLFTLRRGVWNNERLVSEEYFEKATSAYLASKSALNKI